MKKLLFTAFLTVALAFGQATSGSPGRKAGTNKKELAKTKKGAKGKKSDSGTTTTPPPK
jgi:hypothetical protein